MKHFVKSLAAVIILGVTGFLLLADSAESCPHPKRSARFTVSGACGPTGTLSITANKDACDFDVSGAEETQLPPRGRYFWSGNSPPGKPTYDLYEGHWTLYENRTYAGPSDGGPAPTSGYRECMASLESDVLKLRCTEKAEYASEPEPRVLSTCESVLTPQ
ncbi:hypothetical protein [Vitiosangium sp. GDMCC 1.1324]|uniref:hypothetical protein n=1 Tax=Vitiosangium sp. (strain GDMCC 1.1324) TaxID=2138576 RepID=UPI000D3C41B4|nr:hypothetical protein [Vitiosangium sp. GDMCC 1.1324]PTL84714.1 hypothetical protein DAT35_06510 [Vitiosangium sp. GDMCC 1.1324]